MDTCLVCKSKLKEMRISRVQEYNGQWFLIENLPALVCRQCGEIYYTPETHDLVLELVRAGKQPIRTETLSVLDASAA
ncbi:MAG: YgiT-type zinc finger protein [Anaerolineae bacterium]|nr:YgiT-type zinc finger protein [Anaerolineae bacterium]